MRRQITNSEIITAGTDSLRGSLYHCWPGQVVAFNAGAETADIQPMVNDLRFDIVTGATVSEPWPVISGVPIAWPKFGGFQVIGPLAQGDGVVLTAFDLDPTAYFQTNQRSDPAHPARHSGAYWRATPCNLTNAGVSPDSPVAQFVIGQAGQPIQIRFDGSTIWLGNNPTDFIALASLVNNLFTEIIMAAAATPGGPSEPGFKAFALALAALPPPAVGSSLTKAQ